MCRCLVPGGMLEAMRLHCCVCTGNLSSGGDCYRSLHHAAHMSMICDAICARVLGDTACMRCNREMPISAMRGKVLALHGACFMRTSTCRNVWRVLRCRSACCMHGCVCRSAQHTLALLCAQLSKSAREACVTLLTGICLMLICWASWDSDPTLLRHSCLASRHASCCYTCQCWRTFHRMRETRQGMACPSSCFRP